MPRFDPMAEALHNENAIAEFLSSPLIRPAEKEKTFAGAFKTVPVANLVKNFVFLLARKQRLDVFAEIVQAYQDLADEKHGVVRGMVRSTTVLAPEERKRIEETVNRVTRKAIASDLQRGSAVLGRIGCRSRQLHI